MLPSARAVRPVFASRSPRFGDHDGVALAETTVVGSAPAEYVPVDVEGAGVTISACDPTNPFEAAGGCRLDRRGRCLADIGGDPPASDAPADAGNACERFAPAEVHGIGCVGMLDGQEDMSSLAGRGLAGGDAEDLRGTDTPAGQSSARKDGARRPESSDGTELTTGAASAGRLGLGEAGIGRTSRGRHRDEGA